MRVVGELKPRKTVGGKYYKRYKRLKTAGVGLTSVMKGLKTFDMRSIVEGTKKIGPALLKEMEDRTWFKTVDLMKSLS